MNLRASAAVLILSAVAFSTSEASPLTYMIQNEPTLVRWADGAFPIRYSIDQRAATAFPDLQAATLSAASEWQSVPGSKASLQFERVETVSAGHDGKSAVTLNDELFETTGFIAYTTTWFDASGVISEADVQIDASAVRGAYNLEAVMQHELGHLLGLDHSGIVSSTMFPFIAMDAVVPLDSDDRIGLAALYPDGSVSGGAFSGSVRSSRGGVFGAQVVAVDANGSPVAGALTGRDGRFEFTGMPVGEYFVYAEPLDGPVEPQNMSGVWRESTPIFRTRLADPADRMKVTVGSRSDAGELVIDELPPSLNPRWIGKVGGAGSDVHLSATVARVKAGDRVAIAVGGDGFVSGTTTFEFMNPGVERVSDFQYGANYVWATFAVAPTTPSSSLVVVVHSGNEVAALTGGLMVTEQTGRRRTVRR